MDTSRSQEPLNALERDYGEAWAERYDAIFTEVDEAALVFLEALSGPERRAVELAVGTGRVAIPLARRGLEITGVDISTSMLARLEGRVDASSVNVIEGDMAEVPVEGLFPLIFIAFNSFFAISTQDRQLECFRNVASHLRSGGRFVLECFVPDMTRFDRNHRHESERTSERGNVIENDLSFHYPHVQRVDSRITARFPDGSEAILPVSIRYAWPAELDLMARLAGLELEERFEWYDRKPFGRDSIRHVSVYVSP